MLPQKSLIPDRELEAHGYVRVIDESGEDYGYAANVERPKSNVPRRWTLDFRVYLPPRR